MISGYVDPIAFNLFGKPIYWYGIIISTAIFIAYYLAEREGQKLRLIKDTMLDLLLVAVPIAIICARLYYVAFRWDYYSQHTNEIIAIWDGGIAIYGGLIGGLLTTMIFSKKRNIKFIKILDIIAPSLLIGQFIGRWGNFFNHEAYGGIVDKQFLENIFIPQFIVENMYIQGAYHHPTFLYESLWCIIAFFIIVAIRNKLFQGEVLSVYLILYGVERFIVEGMREDSLYLGVFRISQVLSLIMVILGIIFIIYSRFINKKEKTMYINS